MKYNNENRRIKAEQTKTKIYKSGEYLFKTKGYHNVSTDAIVAQAKVAKGSLGISKMRMLYEMQLTEPMLPANTV